MFSEKIIRSLRRGKLPLIALIPHSADWHNEVACCGLLFVSLFHQFFPSQAWSSRDNASSKKPNQPPQYHLLHQTHFSTSNKVYHFQLYSCHAMTQGHSRCRYYYSWRSKYKHTSNIVIMEPPIVKSILGGLISTFLNLHLKPIHYTPSSIKGREIGPNNFLILCYFLCRWKSNLCIILHSQHPQ